MLARLEPLPRTAVPWPGSNSWPGSDYRFALSGQRPAHIGPDPARPGSTSLAASPRASLTGPALPPKRERTQLVMAENPAPSPTIGLRRREANEHSVSESFASLRALIGDTPLVEVHALLQGREVYVYGKLESVNFTGSIKDRMALGILEEAYQRGDIRPGDLIAEASSGNTGIAFAALGRALGHPVRIYMPDWMSRERTLLIRSMGAEVVPVSKEQGGFLGSIALAGRARTRARRRVPAPPVRDRRQRPGPRDRYGARAAGADARRRPRAGRLRGRRRDRWDRDGVSLGTCGASLPASGCTRSSRRILRPCAPAAKWALTASRGSATSSFRGSSTSRPSTRSSTSGTAMRS